MYNKFRDLDIISIFKEEIQNPNFNFETFMMSPNIYIILSQYLSGLFNSLASINNIFQLNLKEFRDSLLNEFNILKSDYNINKGSIYKNLLNFVKKVFKLLNFEIPLEKNFNFKLETENFILQFDSISNKTYSILENLMCLFNSTGLSKYMEKDFQITNYHLRNLKNIEGTKEDYLIFNDGKNKNMHIKMSSIIKLVEDSKSNLDGLLKKKRINDIEVENLKNAHDEDKIEKIKKNRRSEIISVNPKLQVRSTIIESASLTFNPQKLCLVSK